MKATDLIEKLSQYIGDNGDCEVLCKVGAGPQSNMPITGIIVGTYATSNGSNQTGFLVQI